MLWNCPARCVSTARAEHIGRTRSVDSDTDQHASVLVDLCGTDLSSGDAYCLLVLTHPVNKFWTRNLNLQGASAGFFASGEDKLAAQSASPDERWIRLRNCWEYSPVFRAVLAAAALICLVVAVALPRSC